MSKNHSFVPPSYENQNPLSWYEEASKQNNFITDSAQKDAIVELDRLWHEVMEYRENNSSFLKKMFSSNKSTPKGVYMWGGVGRGKSFLMDSFYNCLPFAEKRRVHFHAFMAETHERMRQLKDKDDRLVELAKELAQEAQVLCFDEFHVSDIADAMILGRLLDTMLQQNLVIVATSNYQPDDLYYKGQNRSSFLPTINLINKNFNIINVDSGEDYRLRTLTEAGVFLQPANQDNEAKLVDIFEYLSESDELLDNTVEILGRKLTCKKRSNDTIWFDFKELCFGMRSQQDYLKLAQQYRNVLISGLEKLDETQKDVARRLTWLIDIFYDYRIKVCVTSDVPIEEIYSQGDFAEEFTRTASRMIEMQSEEYLKLPHLTLK